MHRSMQPDWKKLVREQLPDLGLQATRELEIIEELSDLLADAAADRWPDGQIPPTSSTEIASFVRRHIPEWHNLAEEILKATKRTRADLVVVGSKGLTGLRRFLLGSVAHKVARHASCSVLVVRQSGPEGKKPSKR